MALVPLTLRRVVAQEQADDVEIVLITISHPDLAAPVRISSDPTRRLSVEPLRYGTRSRGVDYEFLIASVVTPDDRKGSPPATSLVFDNVSVDMVDVMRSFTSPASVDLELVLSSEPDFVLQAFRHLRLIKCRYDVAAVTVDLSKEPFVAEPFGARQTKQFFPGLFGIAAS